MSKSGMDFTSAFEKFFTASPVNYSDMVKNMVETNTKFAEIAMETAKKNAELSQAWASETFSEVESLMKASAEPAEFKKVATDFISSQAKSSSEHMSAFAEVAKNAQMETVELMLATGAEMQAEVTEAAKKATKTATKAAA